MRTKNLITKTIIKNNMFITGKKLEEIDVAKYTGDIQPQILVYNHFKEIKEMKKEAQKVKENCKK